MFTSIITQLDDSQLVLDTAAVDRHEQYAAWSDCWNELLIQQIGCFSLNRDAPVEQAFDGRLWAIQIAHLIWFCTEHETLSTYLNPNHIAQQTQARCLLLMPLRKRHFQQNTQEMIVEDGQMMLMNQCTPTHSHSLVQQHTLGLVIPKHLLSATLQQQVEQRMLRISAREGMAFALRSLLLTLPQSLKDTDSLLQRQQFSQHLLGLLHLSFENTSTTLETSPQQLLYQEASHEIDRHLDKPKLSCAFVAKRLGISESYLYKLFQQEGKRFSHEIRVRRLDKIAEHLSLSQYAHLSISQVAFHYGFNSSSHFSRTFKEKFGCSPSLYRESHQLQSA